jgi:osmotically-inducible protein OsmY
VRDGVVTLDRFVRTEREKQLGERAAWNLSGVDKVTNNLDVPA